MHLTCEAEDNSNQDFHINNTVTDIAAKVTSSCVYRLTIYHLNWSVTQKNLPYVSLERPDIENTLLLQQLQNVF